MWKKDETPKAPPASFEDEPKPKKGKSSGGRALIGGSLVVEGSIKGQEDLLVEGRVDGDISLGSNTVTVGETGLVKATIQAKVIVVEGRVEGDLFGGEQVEIRRSGHVLGNITAPRVGLEDGAQFKGNIDMSPKAKQAAAAPSYQKPTTDTPLTGGKGPNEQTAGKTADTKFSG